MNFLRWKLFRLQAIHFNNGMHGWSYSEEEYKRAFPKYLKTIRHISKSAVLIWATTTPIKSDSSPGPTNDRIDQRNTISIAVMKKANITVDDQHSLMAQHTDSYEDNVHFGSAGATIQGQQVASIVQNALKPNGGNKVSVDKRSRRD